MTESLNPSDTIARELEALGEEPLSAAELAMLAGDDRDLDDEPAVASVARLIELSRPLEPSESAGLSEIDQQRVWRTIEQRRAPTGARPAARPSRRWAPWVAVSLALAAAAVMLVVLPDDRGAATNWPSKDEVAQVGDQARSALRVLDDGLGDTARAERLSADYQRRLEGTR